MPLKLTNHKTNFVWNCYGKICRMIWRALRPRWIGNSLFTKELFFDGQFPENLVQEFVKEALQSKQITFDPKDSVECYYSNQSTVLPFVETYNKIFIFRRLSPKAMNLLGQCIASITDTVTNCLGSNWRVIQTRYWETKPGGEGIGTNGWHTDGFPLDAIKILCFFSDVDEQKGTTQFKKRDGTIHTFRGPAGKWILFRNSVVEHCGSPPLASHGNRLTVEITLAPALAIDARPVFAGVNGHYPYLPWNGVGA